MTRLAAALQGALDARRRARRAPCYYILHDDPNDPDVLFFYELYTDGDALEGALLADAFKAIGAVLGPLLAGRPELKFLKPVGGKGL